jgi:hypothetical protein
MTFQASLDFEVQLPADAYSYGSRASGEVHGVVLTKPHVVELILDLAGYGEELDLGTKRLLEPSCGHGAFLVVAVGRLLASARAHGRSLSDLADAIAAFDVDESHVTATRTAVREVLERHGEQPEAAAKLTESWIRCGDFLLTPIPGAFDFVVGNPPYIRVEQIALELQAEYRRRYSTIFDRADLYVAFIERGLSLLSDRGVLSFVCADRWTLNRYGAPLRRLITSTYEVRAYVDLHSASPFESDVIAYPSIFVIGRGGSARSIQVATLRSATKDECVALSEACRNTDAGSTESISLTRYTSWFTGDDPWVLSSPTQLAVLRELESRFPLLEEDGRASVRIGVASGNDSIYIVPEGVDIEPDRLLPLVMREDIDRGEIRDARRFIINTFEAKGAVDLARYPRLARYFEQHESAIRSRHVAQKQTYGWFRTIDRVYPEMVAKPKLLIPDIAGSNQVVLDTGRFFPHHNLYYVVSDTWDMEVLGGLLSSRVALFFVWSYAVKMRGGYLRFQAQYLRRIRVPDERTISLEIADRIRRAFRSRDFTEIDECSRIAYGLDALPEFEFIDTRK